MRKLASVRKRKMGVSSMSADKHVLAPKSSRFRDMLKRFCRNKTALIGFIIIVILILVAIFAHVIAPYGYDDQNLNETLQKPSAAHWFGTDNYGRDMFSRIVYGTRISIFVGLMAASIGVLFGGILGSLAGFYGGRVDAIIMRMTDVVMAIPVLIMAVVICAVLGNGLMNTMIAVGITIIPSYTRVVRSAVLTARQQDYVEASRAVGGKDFHIILRHVVPNSLAPVIVQASLGVAEAILSAASMSFIGLGIQPPTPEWGAMLSAGRSYIRDFPGLEIFPGLAIVVTILAINLFGDGLRDALDPKLKR